MLAVFASAVGGGPAAGTAAGQTTTRPAVAITFPDEFGPAANGLRLRIGILRREFQEWETIAPWIVFRNVSDDVLVLQRGAATLEVDGRGASYAPYLGLPGSIFGRTRSIQPGDVEVIDLNGLWDGGGHWLLAPGRYRIRMTFRSVDREPTDALPGRVWKGEVRSNWLELSVVPASSMHRALMAMAAVATFSGGREKVLPQLLALGDEADVELLRMLHDAGREPHHFEAWAAGARRLREAVPVLLAGVRDFVWTGERTGRSVGQYEWADYVTALGRIGDPRAIEPLRKQLGNPKLDDIRRLALVRAVGRLRDQEAVPKLREYIQAGDWQLQAAARAALMNVTGEDTVTPLLQIVVKEVPQAAPTAFAILRAMGEDTAPRLLALYETSTDRTTVAKTGSLLGLIIEKGFYRAEITAAAVKKAHSEDPEMRYLAPFVLRRAKSPQVVEVMIGLLRDEEDRVRREAASVLGDFRDPKAVEPLLALLRDHSRPSDEHAIVPLLSFRREDVDAAMLAEFEKGGKSFRSRLVSVVGAHVAYGEATAVAVRWLEKIAADPSLGDLSHVAQHDLNLRKQSASQP